MIHEKKLPIDSFLYLSERKDELALSQYVNMASRCWNLQQMQVYGAFSCHCIDGDLWDQVMNHKLRVNCFLLLEEEMMEIGANLWHI